MSTDIETLWALIAGLLLLFANFGAVVMVEGLTRKRSVLTVSARHLAGASGAILGTIAIASFDSGLASESSVLGIDYSLNVQLWLSLSTAVLLTTLAMAGLAERSTVLSHLIVGLAMGAILIPFVSSARLPNGFLSSIEFGERNFIDTAAATLFAVAGVSALVGTMIVGPRRGRSGPAGSVRSIPGKSMPVALMGVLVMIPALIGVLGRPGEPWNEEVVDAAIGLMFGGAAGAIVGIVVGALLAGRVELVPVLQGTLAGIVSATGDPLGLTTLSLGSYAAAGAALALLLAKYLERVAIDDPIGVVTSFGVAGVWGSLTVGFADSDQFLAQVLGVGLIITLIVIVMGVVFGPLRIFRLLRIDADIEVAGLEL